MLCQSTHGQIALYARARLPADALSSVKIQDNRKKKYAHAGAGHKLYQKPTPGSAPLFPAFLDG
jgi:hypothetical protein